MSPFALRTAHATGDPAATAKVARADGATASTAGRSLVRIELAGDPSAVAAVESILREHLAQPGFEVSFATIDAVDPAVVLDSTDAQARELARLWIDLPAAGGITLYLVDGERERVLVRHFARHDNPEVAREELGHVVELALLALRAGERIGVGHEAARAELALPAPAPAPPALAPPPPPSAVPAEKPRPTPPAPRPKTRLRAGAFYEAEAYAGGPEVWSGPGLMLELRRRAPRPRLGYGALLSGQYRLPSNASVSSSTNMRFEGGAVQALAIGSVALSKPAELALGIGAGLNLVHAEARGDRVSEVHFTGGSTRLLPSLRALVRYEHAVPSLRLFLGVGVDVPLESTRYVLSRPDETVVLFQAWSARPFVLAGIQTP